MASILKISEALALGIHACAILAIKKGQKLSTIQIAQELKASEAHLSKVMQRLVKADLLMSTRGPGGGFQLARPEKQIRLLEIYEAIEGKFPEGDCLFETPPCQRDSCLLENLVARINREAFDYFFKTKLADLTNKV
ncbi:MAG: hypothetical protein A2X49_11580 [Lentisphaerae bacterium GWF2_52_8]|nr:MAG: hypothetical protein A2X49_11580 [Lentisphaerae bacterium GWF2_52_8]